MDKKPKVLKKVNIKSHLMRTKQGTTTVKQHTRMQEVNITGLNEILHKASQIDNPVTQCDKIIDMYKTGFHTITDTLLDNHPYKLKEVYKNILNSFDLNRTFSEDDILKRISSPEYIKGISDKMDEIEIEFRKKFNGTNCKIERISPFTCSIEHNISLPNPFNLNAIHDGMESLLIRTKIAKNGVIFRGQSGYNLRSNLKTIEHFLNTYPQYRKQTIKTIAPMYLLDHMYEYAMKPSLHINTDVKNITSKLSKDTQSNLKEFYDIKMGENSEKILNNEKTVPNYLGYTDTESIRKDFLKFMKEKEEKPSEFTQKIRKARSNEIPLILGFSIKFGESPDFMIDNPNFSKELNRLTENVIRSPYDNIRSSGLDKLYITKNPLEYLNMSPMGRFESCQSIGNIFEDIDVDSLNANVLSSFNQDKNHDFILHNGIKEGNGFVKTARMSLWYDKNAKKSHNIINWEEGVTYGNNSKHKDILSLFGNDKLNMYNVDIDDYDDLYVNEDHFSKSIINKSKEDINELNQLGRSYVTHKSVETGRKISDLYEKVVKDIAKRFVKADGDIFNDFINKGNSMHYDSPLHTYLTRYSSDTLEGCIANVQRNLFKICGLHNSGISSSFFDFSRKHNIQNNIDEIKYRNPLR